MGLAVEAPVADRGGQRHRFAIEEELPVRRRERGHDTPAAPARAGVDGGRVLHCDVQDAGLEMGRDQVDELVLQSLEAAHALPSLLIEFPSIV